ncbi:DUF1045 domain-containing protein [Undibacterium sp. Ji50W]|uniref:DUF1045 domain-containing protein n=1 Tax=Undibacterium sp. Ji50W TaxID=3413041 RepID=UPI003BF21F94
MTDAGKGREGMTRYALYFAPDSDNAWWHAGNQWLGRDADAARDLPQPPLDGIQPDVQHQLTQDARRYGFHATLKAPFHLAPGYTEAALHLALEEFCQQLAPVTGLAPGVQWMGNFLALRPTKNQTAINELAFACVQQFDRFRAPMSTADLARRQQHPLNARQQALLMQWGYPYTQEEFRFHMTLTDRLEQGPLADHFHAAAQAYFDLDTPLDINSIALFTEPQPGADFQLSARFPFGR